MAKNLVHDVLAESWESEHEHVCLDGTKALAKFARKDIQEPWELDGERARQAALGHKLLFLVYSFRNDMGICVRCSWPESPECPYCAVYKDLNDRIILEHTDTDSKMTMSAADHSVLVYLLDGIEAAPNKAKDLLALAARLPDKSEAFKTEVLRLSSLVGADLLDAVEELRRQLL